MTFQVEVPVSDVDEYQADDRGRVTLGSEFAGKDVTVAIVEVDE